MSQMQHLTLRERIHDEIVRMIVDGELAAGAPIDERDLVGRLTVSRTPFREAISMLEKEGLIEVRPYRGYNVRAFTKKEIGDLYELRKTLEGLAVRLAVKRITDEDVEELASLLTDAVECLHADDMAGYSDRDRKFHERIAELSDNRSLRDALGRISLQMQACRVFANQSPDLAERATHERDAILEALRKRDAKAAERRMQEHISDVQRSVLKRI